MTDKHGSSAPPKWATAVLRDIADVQLGKMLDAKRTAGVLMRYLRNVNVRWGQVDTADLAAMHFQDHELQRYSVQEGDVLVCEGGEPGRAAVWAASKIHVKYQKALHRVRLKGGILPSWLVYSLFLDAKTGGLAHYLTGSTIGHLPLESILGYRIPVAPIAEQHRVTQAVESHLTRLDDAVATLERVQRNLKRYRASVLKAAVEGRLVPTEAELARAEKRDYEPAERLLDRILVERRRRWEEAELARLKAAGKIPQDDKWRGKYQEPARPDTNRLPGLPEGWCWSTIGQVAPLQAGYAFKSDGFANAGVRLLKGNNVRDGWLATDDIDYWPAADAPGVAQYKLSSGDVVLAMDRPVYSSGSRATKVAMLTSEWDNALLLQRVGCFRRSPSLDAEYLYLFASGPEFRAHIVSSQNGSQDGKDLPHVSAGTVDSSPFPLPPQAEQARIVEAVARLLSVQTNTERSATESRLRCARLRQSILKWAFEGKLADQDPTDEPASALLERIRSERAAASTGKATPNDKTKKSPGRKPGRPAKKS